MRQYSWYVWWLILIFYLLAFYTRHNWKDGIVSGGDAWGYYVYLPAAFIYGDLNDNIQESYKVRKLYHGGFQVESLGLDAIGEAPTAPNGKRVIKYTMGVSILQSPFFGLAHITASLTGYPQDGYSKPYLFCVHFSALFFALAGLWLIRKILLRHFSEIIVAWTLLALAFATNLFYFSLYTLSHVYLFFLYAVLIHQTLAWYEDGFKLRNALLVGISAGLIVLIRPVEMLCLAIPLLYGCSSFATLKTRWQQVLTYWKGYALAVVAFVAMGLPQILYWHWNTGDFFYYSYTNEKFNFLHPQIKEGLFYFENGWLAYTPIMFLGLLGCLFLWKSYRQWFLPIFLLLPLHIYITYSWWCWQYVNGFGSRPMVDIYPVMAIVLAVNAQVLGRWIGGKGLLGISLIFFSFLNIFNTYQFHLGILWSESANFQYYKRIFGKTTTTYLDLVTYDTGENQPDSAQLLFLKKIGENNLEDSTNTQFVREPKLIGNFVLKLDPESKHTALLAIPMQHLHDHKGHWLRISAQARKGYDGVDIYKMATLSSFFGAAKPKKPHYRNVNWRQIRLDNKVENTQYNIWGGKRDVWGEVYYWTQIPENLSSEDTFYVYAANDTPNPIWIDNLKVDLYETKK